MRIVSRIPIFSKIFTTLTTVLLLQAAEIDAVPHRYDEPLSIVARENNEDVKLARALLESRQRARQMATSVTAVTAAAGNRLQYAIMRFEPSAHATVSAPPAFVSTTTTRALNIATKKARQRDETPGGDAQNNSEISEFLTQKADKILKRIQQSGLVETISRIFTAPKTMDNPYRSAPIERIQPAVAADSPKFSTSIDAHAENVNVDSKPGPETPFRNFDWKHTLFGPSGIFTEMFNMINEKRKSDARATAEVARAAVAAAAKTHADSGVGGEPNGAGSAIGGTDFIKFIELFLLKTQNGNFDEPPPEIPFLGVCDRLSCADIYKAFDEFRKSELFTNFQTAISLLHDQKGWDIIGELLANPDLIENFIGGARNGVDNGNEIGASGTKLVALSGSKGDGAAGAAAESTDDGLGIDFSALVDERPVSAAKTASAIKTSPEIAENVDYYSSVDKGEIEEKIPSQFGGVRSSRPSSTAGTEPTKPAKSTIGTVVNGMPEIALSIDEFPDESEHVDLTMDRLSSIVETPEGAIRVPESVLGSKRNGNNGIGNSERIDSRARNLVPTESKFEEGREYRSQTSGTNMARTTAPNYVARVYGKNGSRLLGAHEPEAGSGQGRTQSIRPSATATRHKAGMVQLRMGTTVPPAMRTTRRNFRRNDDYYVMYYDAPPP